MTIHTTYHKHIVLTLLAISAILCGIFHYTTPAQGANSPPVVQLPNPMKKAYTVDNIHYRNPPDSYRKTAYSSAWYYWFNHTLGICFWRICVDDLWRKSRKN